MLNSSKLSVNGQAFFDAHIAGRSFSDRQEYAFLLGYYVHLVTDHCYQNFVRNPKRVAACFSRLHFDANKSSQIAGMPETFDALKTTFGRNALFRDIAIYENNWAFDHPNSAYHQILRNVVQFPDYLPMFPAGAFPRKIAVMTGETTQTYPEDPFPFFTKQEWQDFLTDTEERLLLLLKEKASV